MYNRKKISNPACAWSVLFITLSISFYLSGIVFADTIDDTKTALEKWVETQRVISKEKQDLIIAKEMLTSRIQLVKREIELQREKITEAKNSIDEADKRREELVQENSTLKQASESLLDTLATLETRTQQLLTLIPEYLREKVKPLSQRLPDHTKPLEEGLKTTVSTRFQNVVGILNELNKANRDIVVISEVRTLPDGTSAEVATLYLGVGQAYYVNSNATLAGIGTLSDSGWVWKPANESAQLIAQAIAVLNNEQAAVFVPMPAEIK